MGLPIVSVIYDEWKPETYAGFKVSFDDGAEEVVFSGNSMNDWLEVQRKYKDFYRSSTVDNFINDMFRDMGRQ